MNGWCFIFYFVGYLNSQEIIAHRGASTDAPENTMDAFHLAEKQGADILELDVRQTADGKLVILHDSRVDRTTNGTGEVSELQYESIRLLDAGSWFHPKFKTQRVPLLTDVFKAFPTKIRFLIELKPLNKTTDGLEQTLIQKIEQFSLKHRVILKSFHDGHLERFKNIAPEIPRLKIVVAELGWINLIIENGLQFGTILDDDVHYIQMHRLGLTKQLIKRAHRKGYKVFVWSVNSKESMKMFIEYGVDGIETDHPEMLRKLKLQN